MKHTAYHASKRTIPPVIATAIAAVSIGLAGCTSTQNKRIATSETPRQNTLPTLTLPAPATQPSSPAPLAALQAYAIGRDALLRGDKSTAIDSFTAAIEQDATSAVIWQDFGTALLGRDNTRALAAFRQASAFDPLALAPRVAAARLLIDRNELPAALEQLRLARLSPACDDDTVTAAVVDLLLARLFEEQGRFADASDAYTRVLPVVEAQSIELRGEPELVQLTLRPNILRLKMADLAAKAGKPGEAVALYRQLMADEPPAAPVFRLRIAQVLADSGNIAGGASEALAVVEQFDGNRASAQAYIDLFENHGGAQAALDYLQPPPPAAARPATARAVLAARLCLRLDQPQQAIDRLDAAKWIYTAEYVRETVAAYRQAGRGQELIVRLLSMMNEQPAAWPQIGRGWRILTHQAQPDPLRDQALLAITVPEPLTAARAFVAASIAREAGKPIVAQRQLNLAAKADGPLLKKWLAAQSSARADGPDVDPGSERDIALFVDEFDNEPPALAAGVGAILKQGGKEILLEALQAAAQRPKSSVAVLGPLVTMLAADDQKAEAVRQIEQAATKYHSAGELYYVSSLFTQLNENESAARVLRLAYDADPNNAAVCNDLGYSLIESGRETKFAQSLLWKAAGLEPDNPAYIDSVGWMLYKSGDFEQALDYLDRAVGASDPADPVVLDHAGDAAYRLKKIDVAIQRWKAAVEMIRRGASGDPQLRLLIDHKLQQAERNEPVSVSSTSP